MWVDTKLLARSVSQAELMSIGYQQTNNLCIGYQQTNNLDKEELQFIFLPSTDITAL